MVLATPTGSTAYAFSAGGPVVWPDVEALLLVPISAHALFAGPMVVSPESVLAVEVIGATAGLAAGRRPTGGPDGVSGAVLWCDGRRMVELPPGARVEVRRGAKPVLLARLRGAGGGGSVAGGEDAGIGASFTDRLVAKFGLPVAGWRGRGEARQPPGRAVVRGEGARGDEEPAGDA
jgi:NAD+ kinase